MSEKLKPKGVPGRKQQNLLYLLVGTIIGAIVAGAAVAVILPKTAAPEASPTPTWIPTEVPFAFGGTSPDSTPPPTYTPSGFNGAPVATVIAPRINAVAVAPDGKSIAASAWDMGNGFVDVHTFFVDANLTGNTFQIGTNTSLFEKLAYSPDSRKLAAMSVYGDIVVLYDLETHVEQERFAGYSSAAFSADGKLLVLGGGQNGLRVLNAATLDLISSIPLTGYLQSLAISPDGKQVAVALADLNSNTTRIALVNLAQPTAAMMEYGLDANYVSDMVFHPSGQVLAAAAHNSIGMNSSLRVFDLKSGSQRFFQLDEMGRVRTVRFDPTGNWLAAGGGESGMGILGSIHLWRWDESGILRPDENWLEERILTGHAHDVNSLAFMPDGKFLLSASSDGSLRLWDYRNSIEISRMQI
jgi:WD40 repeat protein